MRLHYLVWGDETKPPLITTHGKGDNARSWDFFAERLCQTRCLYAMDMRGHGDSDWAAGGGYLIADYVTDLSALVREIDRGPVALIGHSLGGRVVPFYAAAFPEMVTSVISIEGLGGFLAPGTTTERLRTYEEEVRKLEGRSKWPYKTLEEATERMAKEHPDLAPHVVQHLATHAVREQADGTLVWKFDPFVRLQPFYDAGLEATRDVWHDIKAPLLVLVNDDSWQRMSPGRREVLESLPNARIETVADAGHWLHLSRPDVFLKLVEDFLRQA
jgi:pimeloyl-ACP methyl ester carboxylesterase